ncbi:hypothetical protein BC826DRAFT_572274 [Russula brevipes]|nr:hypothetical protein BC826DRAFT_572274 [Russula brevipes]
MSCGHKRGGGDGGGGETGETCLSCFGISHWGKSGPPRVRTFPALQRFAWRRPPPNVVFIFTRAHVVGNACLAYSALRAYEQGAWQFPTTKNLHALHQHVRATAHSTPALSAACKVHRRSNGVAFFLVARACVRDVVGVGVRESRHGGLPWEVTLCAIERAHLIQTVVVGWSVYRNIRRSPDLGARVSGFGTR